MTTVGDCTALQFCGSNEPCQAQSHSTFCTCKFVSIVICGKLSRAQGILAGVIVLVLRVSLPMTLKSISPSSRRSSCTLFYQRTDRKGMFTPSILEATCYLAQMIGISIIKPTIKVS